MINSLNDDDEMRHCMLTYWNTVRIGSGRGGCQLRQRQHAQRRRSPTVAQHLCHHRNGRRAAAAAES